MHLIQHRVCRVGFQSAESHLSREDASSQHGVAVSGAECACVHTQMYSLGASSGAGCPGALLPLLPLLPVAGR